MIRIDRRCVLAALIPLFLTGCATRKDVEMMIAQSEQTLRKERVAACEQLEKDLRADMAVSDGRLQQRITALSDSLEAVANRLQSALKDEALDRAQSDHSLLETINKNAIATNTRIDQLDLKIDQAVAELYAALTAARKDMADLRMMLARMPLDYSGLMFIAGSNIADQIDTVARKHVPREMGDVAPVIIVLDASNKNGAYCVLGYDLSHQIAAILGARQLTSSPIRTQDDVEQKMVKLIFGEAPDIYNREHLEAIGINPEHLFYLSGRIERSGSGYRAFYQLHRGTTDELYPVSTTGETIPRTEDTDLKFEETHLTPLQRAQAEKED